MTKVHNLTKSQIDEDFIKKIIRKVLKGEGKEENISLVFIGSERMRELNERYRGKNRVTDVLTFGEDLKEIVICLSEVKKNARRFKSSFNKELALVLVHGILHLLGYDHEKSEKKAEKMREKEKYYLKCFVREGELLAKPER